MINNVRIALVIGALLMGFGLMGGRFAIAGPILDGVSAFNQKDYPTALRIFRALADQGDAGGQMWLGVMYRSGSGVAKDDKEAVKWFRLSAEQGNSGGQIHLGGMYRDGRGVAQDNVYADMWFNIVDEKSRAAGLTYMNATELEAKMTPEQIAKAKEMAAKCKSANYKNCD